MVAQAAKTLGRLASHEQVVLGFLAVLVGALSGLGSIGFRYLIDATQWIFFGPGALGELAAGLPWYQVVAVPTFGGLLVGVLCVYVLPGAPPRGVAEVIEANALRNGRMSLNAGLSATLVSGLSIGCGASVGREGPIVHLGGSLASYVARKLHLGPSLSRTLLGCGVAAAIAAAFNAPIAGVFFALEVVIGHYGLGAFSPVVIASVVGTMLTRIHFGDVAAFSLPPQIVTSFWEMPAFVILGLLCGLLSILLIKSVGWVQDFHDRLRIPLWLRPAVAGVAVGGIAVGCPEVLGIGYDTNDAALRGNFVFTAVVTIALAKSFATVVSLGSRFGGGIFSPSLVIGATVGVAYGMVVGGFFPELSSNYTLYGILGMGAMAASTIGAPISTVIMIFELTLDYGATFALMAAVAVSAIVTKQLLGHSFFTWQLAQRGVSVSDSLEMGVLDKRKVRDVMHRDCISVGEDTPISELCHRFRNSHLPIFVSGDDGRLLGTVAVEDLADVLVDHQEENENFRARDLVRQTHTVLVPDDNLVTALKRSRAHDEDHIPVVRSKDDMTVIGEVRQRDLLLAYNRALLEARARERGEG
ncbi:MAG: chloride channel protein [Geminicoccaceae bacterium]